jgi:stage II sporulation protein AA (anti-sigma F factor antagonist)
VHLDIRTIRNTVVVRTEGELDMLVAERLRQEVDEILSQKGVKNLILNLEKVTFIDSSGLGVIIGRYKKVSSTGGRMYIVGVQPQVEKILQFSGINRLISIYSNEQDIINL